MNRSIVLTLALVLTPAIASAQDAPPGPPPAGAGWTAASPAQRAQMEQFRSAASQVRAQTRANMLASLSPAHRSAVASIVGQLAIAPNPNLAAAVATVDGMLSPGEKQSIVNVSTAERTNMRTLMQQQRAAMEATLSADEKARMQQREAERQAFMQSHPRPQRAVDPGAILLRTLADVGGPMHGRGMEPR